jgi:hypothetical protein
VKFRAAFFFVIALMADVLPGFAAEPGVANNYPPGATLGSPTGFAKAPGVYLSTSSTLYDAEGYNESGIDTGVHSTSFTVTPTILWFTGWRLLGGQYFVTAIQPTVDVEVRKPTAHVRAFGLANPYLSPVNIAWLLAPGFSVAASAGVYLPSGGAVIRNDFWTYESQLSLSYMRQDWYFSVRTVYDINSIGEKSRYRTGDRLYADISAIRKASRWKFGPVVYVVCQTTDDENNGIAYGSAAPVFGRETRVAGGGYLAYDFGGVTLGGFYTHEFFMRSGSGGSRLRLTLEVPLW